MENVKEKEIILLQKEDVFLRMTQDLLRATGFVNHDGEYIPLTWFDIRVYLYVKEKVRYFSSQGREYFDTQEMIAYCVGISLSSLRRSMKKFVDNKIISCYKKKFNNYENWRYVGVEDLMLYKEVDTEMENLYQKRKNRKEKSNNVVKQKKKSKADDFADLPF